jgi:hypothetical protein
MSLRTEIFWQCLNKYGEELCGDKVESIQNPKETIMVMADGLGSGVKANILSTLTTKIAVTMLKEGSSIEETVETMVSTLPICNVRKIAYSTFTIVRVDSKGQCYIAEYGNPAIFLLRQGSITRPGGKTRIIAEREVKETRLVLEEGDILVAVSDGVVHAGVGGILNLGWQWENIAQYIEKTARWETSIRGLVKLLSNVTLNFYMEQPGDDATVVALKVIAPRRVTLFTGPPQNPEDDEKVVENLMETSGQKVVCGGTAAQIVARVLDREIVTSTDFADPSIPPTAKISGINLVTEGVLTLARTREIINRYTKPDLRNTDINLLAGEDGASLLAKTLVDSTDITFLLGRAVNPAHQNPDFPRALSIKLNIVKEIIKDLKLMGKLVNASYY